MDSSKRLIASHCGEEAYAENARYNAGCNKISTIVDIGVMLKYNNNNNNNKEMLTK